MFSIMYIGNRTSNGRNADAREGDIEVRVALGQGLVSLNLVGLKIRERLADLIYKGAIGLMCRFSTF